MTWMSVVFRRSQQSSQQSSHDDDSSRFLSPRIRQESGKDNVFPGDGEKPIGPGTGERDLQSCYRKKDPAAYSQSSVNMAAKCLLLRTTTPKMQCQESLSDQGLKQPHWLPHSPTLQVAAATKALLTAA
ncbi:hypothetical protein STEG23_023310, partial [Scotinomys teguina]